MFQLSTFGMRSAWCFVFCLSCPVCKINKHYCYLSASTTYFSGIYFFFNVKNQMFLFKIFICCIFCCPLDPSPWGSPILAMPLHMCLICTSSFHKETIMCGHDHHNTTILSIIHSTSTTCFSQHYFWLSSGWIQLSEKTTQYMKWYSTTISVGVSGGGRDLVYKRVGGRLCVQKV